MVVWDNACDAGGAWRGAYLEDTHIVTDSEWALGVGGLRGAGPAA